MTLTSTTTTSIASSSSSSLKLLLTPRKSQPAVDKRCIYAWTFSAAAVALAFAKDVHELREDHAGEPRDIFFWLGSVPCRTVTIVGIIVDVWERERSFGFSVDDGTATLECACRSSSVATTPNLPRLGDTVRVTGKVYPRRRGGDITRQLDIERNAFNVTSASAEPLHILNVARLHSSLYSRPFVVPVGTHTSFPTTPTTTRPSTPSTARPFHRSPSKLPPSPVKSVISQSSPPRVSRPATLTHPANLRTKERTRNTFRIYLKAYMCAPPHAIRQGSGAVFGQPRPKHGGTQQADMSTLSTLPSHSQLPDRSADLERTPTQRKRRRQDMDASPPEPSGPELGFTRAFLERVTELAQLAAAVARVERHVRDKPAAQPKQDRPRTREEKEAADALAARSIFIDALRKLCEQGAIVLHEGNVWAFDSDAGVVTEPWSGAGDAYVPVTPELLRGPVEKVLSSYSGRTLAPEDVTKVLKRRDERWRCLNVWDVRDAIELTS